MPRLAAGFDVTPRGPYRPAPGRVDRLSLVWWANGPTADADPLLAVHDDGGASALVARWPTDTAGRIVRDRIAEVEVLEWRLSADDLAALAGHHRAWPLGACDVAVSIRGGRLDLSPCLASLWGRALASDTPPALAVVRTVRPAVDRLARQLVPEAAA